MVAVYLIVHQSRIQRKAHLFHMHPSWLGLTYNFSSNVNRSVMAFFQGVIQGLLTSICQSNVLQECCHPGQASLASMKTVVITLVASSLKLHGQQTMHTFFQNDP